MKFSYPQTAAQEVGWDMDNYHKLHTPKGQLGSRNIRCSNEVNYAADYLKY